MLPRLGFIGAGRVANALAPLWYEAGYPVTAIASRTYTDAVLLARTVGGQAMSDLTDVVERCDIVFLTVPDDTILLVAQSLADLSWANKVVVHTSGSKDISVLADLAAQGASVASLHPSFPFVGGQVGLSGLYGTTFAVESSDAATDAIIQALVSALGGVLLVIPPGQKALYHAALCLCSNYTVTLYAVAQRLLLTMGTDRVSANAALRRLLQATVENLMTRTPDDALTGPLVRGDISTLEAHLHALPDAEGHLYTALARATYPLLQARGIALEPIEAVFQKGESS